MSGAKTFIIICLMTALSSCSSKHDDKTAWDETSRCLKIEGTGLCYTPPTDISNWIIADDENLIFQIKFCGVDTVSRICMTVINPETDCDNVAGMDSAAVYKQIREITCQYPSESIIKFDPEIERCVYNGADSWKFTSDISIKEGFDTVSIANHGYFFDCGNEILGIVATIPGIVADKMSDDDIEKYLSGLRTGTSL